MDLAGWRNDGIEECSDLEEKRNLQCHTLEEGHEMKLGIWCWMIGSFHFLFYT